MSTQLNELRRLLAEIDSLAGSVEVSGLIRDARACAEKARSRTAKAIKIVIELDAQAGEVTEGWKLVPIDPTSQMTFVGQSLRYDAVNSIGEIYRQMIAAAPAQGGDVNGS